MFIEFLFCEKKHPITKLFLHSQDLKCSWKLFSRFLFILLMFLTSIIHYIDAHVFFFNIFFNVICNLIIQKRDQLSLFSRIPVFRFVNYYTTFWNRFYKINNKITNVIRRFLSAIRFITQSKKLSKKVLLLILIVSLDLD